MSRARVAFYGDDFTGSVDALLQFARRGWTGRLFATLPDAETLRRAASEVDVVGVAGIARSLSPAQLDAELRPVLRAFAHLEPSLVQYKACSTADSAPDVGSLGRVIEIGREVLSARSGWTPVVPMLFAQPDFGRYTVFGQHFAAERGTVYRLDRQPTMSQHPSTPMTEADLAVHIGRQTDAGIGAISLLQYHDLAACLRAASEAGIVLDALTDEHLIAVGRALQQLPGPVFAIGSGGLSHGIAAAAPGDAPTIPTTTGARGPMLVVSGSRSAQTRRQADAAAAAGWLVRPLPRDGAGAMPSVLEALHAGRGVVLTSDDIDTSTVGTHGRPALEAIAESSAAIVATAVREGATERVIVCGGDTSSRVVRMLGVQALSIAANPWGNVVVLRAHAADPAIDGVELLLKGGQVGADTLFADVAALSG